MPAKEKYVFLTRTTAFLIFMRDRTLRKEMSFREFLNFHTQSGVCLRTGAKLVKNYEHGFMIHGYHYNGEDLDPYRKWDRRTKVKKAK